MGKHFSTELLTNGMWQDSSNNIGIGAANSYYKFQVTGTTNLTGALSGTDISLQSSNFDILKWQKTSGTASNVYSLSADSSGAYIQDVTNTKTLLYLAENTGAATFSSSVTAGGSSTFSAASGTLTADILTVRGGGSSGAFGFKVEANNGEDIFYTNNQNYNIIANPIGGNFGIGTSSPLQRLHVYNSASSSAAIFQGSSNSYIQLGVSSESYIGNVSLAAPAVVDVVPVKNTKLPAS